MERLFSATVLLTLWKKSKWTKPLLRPGTLSRHEYSAHVFLLTLLLEYWYPWCRERKTINVALRSFRQNFSLSLYDASFFYLLVSLPGTIISFSRPRIKVLEPSPSSRRESWSVHARIIFKDLCKFDPYRMLLEWFGVPPIANAKGKMRISSICLGRGTLMAI